MTKQLMIYENAVPLSSSAHRDLSVKPTKSLAFARDLTAVPLVVAEFERAGAEFPIVFAGEGDALFPVAVLGLRGQQNLFLDAAGHWQGDYIPAFLRRYPFVFARAEEGDDLTLCIDTGHDGVNADGLGERMFDAMGNRTRYLEDVVKFATDYQVQHNATRVLMDRLRALDLLEPAQAKGQLPTGETLALTGFWRVSVEKLTRLPDAAALDLFRSGAMALIYLHLASLGQISLLMRRAADQIPAQVA